VVKPAQTITGIQPDLFQQLEQPALERDAAPSLCMDHELRGAMATALRLARQHYGYSRDRIIDRMNLCLEPEDKITVRQLNAWMAISQEDKDFKAKYLPAFCWATHSILPFQVLLNAIDFEPVDLRDQQALRLGQLTVEKARLAREERHLRTRLGG